MDTPIDLYECGTYHTYSSFFQSYVTGLSTEYFARGIYWTFTT